MFTKTFFDRLFKLVILIGVPVLGLVYFYAQLNSVTPSDIVPFKTFVAPETLAFKEGKKQQLLPVKFTKPITVINFWASWCPPCVREFPSMLQLQQRLGEENIDFVFISVDDQWGMVDQFQKTNGINLPKDLNLWDPSKKAAFQWGTSKFPETYIVRSDSWVVEKIVGEQYWTRPSVIRYFENLINKYNDL